MLPLTSAALGIRHSTYDAGALYDSVLQVTVDGEPRCAATIVASRNSSSTSLAISAASCFLKTAVLSREQQADCLRGTCSSDIIVPASSIHLVGGPDSREAPIVARVKRLAVRFTAWWAMADVCSSALCGEGWDVALLELEHLDALLEIAELRRDGLGADRRDHEEDHQGHALVHHPCRFSFRGCRAHACVAAQKVEPPA